MRLPIALLAFSVTLVIVPAATTQDLPDVLPKVVQHSQPIYPPLARQTRIQEEVRVKLTTDGESVTNAEAVAGHPLFRKAAEDNARTWKFAPHNPGTFYVTFRYKLASGDVDVEFLASPALVEIEAPRPQRSIYYAWIALGRWKAQLTSARGKSRQTFELSYSGPDGEWLNGNILGPNGENEEFDFGHKEKEGDFVAFTVKLRRPDGKQSVTFFAGKLKGNKIIGTFVDGAGVTGKWTAVRLPEGSQSRQVLVLSEARVGKMRARAGCSKTVLGHSTPGVVWHGSGLTKPDFTPVASQNRADRTAHFDFHFDL